MAKYTTKLSAKIYLPLIACIIYIPHKSKKDIKQKSEHF